MLFKHKLCCQKMQCPYCQTNFSSKSSLTKHIQTAKYCLEKRGESGTSFTCEYCLSSFTSNFMLKNHSVKCSAKPVYERLKSELIKKDEIIRNLKQENARQKELEKINKHEILECKKQLKKYEIHINDLTKKVGTKNITKVNFIQNYFADVKPLDLSKNRVCGVFDKLKVEDTLNKASGIDNFLQKNLLTDEYQRFQYICTDSARRMFRFKDFNQEIRRDKRCINLFNKIFEPLVDKIRELYAPKSSDAYDEISVARGLYFTDPNGTFKTDLISCLSSSTIPKKMISKNSDNNTALDLEDSDFSENEYYTIEELDKNLALDQDMD